MIINTIGFWRSRDRKLIRMIMLMPSPSLEISPRLRVKMVLMLSESSVTARKNSLKSEKRIGHNWVIKWSMASRTIKTLATPRDKHQLRKDLHKIMLDSLKQLEMVGLTANCQSRCNKLLKLQTANTVEVPPWDKSPKETEERPLDKLSVCQVGAHQSRNQRLPRLM